ncbi:MAG: sodium:proton antiporter [Gemmatimonadales bacterium]|nr:MAG: sodium:proton antiporter [Gemmatimonadales bacterium]
MKSLTSHYDSLFLHVVTKAIVPLIQIFALYVITHGHYSPGGGFQGGVMMAASILLLRITLGEASYRRFPREAGLAIAGVATLLFCLLGFASVVFGGNFLEYGMAVPGADPVRLRYWGIFWAEVFIGFLVWGALVAIYDALVTGGVE